MARSGFLLALLFTVAIACITADPVDNLRGAKPEATGNDDSQIPGAAEMATEKHSAEIGVIEAEVPAEVADQVDQLVKEDILEEVTELQTPEANTEVAHVFVDAPPVVVGNPDELKEDSVEAAEPEETEYSGASETTAEQAIGIRRLQGGDHLRLEGGRLVRVSEPQKQVRSIGDALVDLITGTEKLVEPLHTESSTEEKTEVDEVIVKHIVIDLDKPAETAKEGNSDRETSSTTSEQERERTSSEETPEIDEVIVTHIIVDADKPDAHQDKEVDDKTNSESRNMEEVVVEHIPMERTCFECDVDYFGNDVKKIENGVSSMVACQKLCQEHNLCDFFTYVESWGGCYLKHSRMGKVEEKEKVLISGLKYCTNTGNVECHGKNIKW